MADTMRLDVRRGMELHTAGSLNQYLAFSTAGETFAMDIRTVKEVIQFSSLTEVPLVPSFIRGVINLRGAVVPVIDLALRFGHSATEVTRRTCIVIAEVGSGESASVLGAMVESVSEVLDIDDRDIEPPPTFGSELRPEFISGIGKINGRFTLLLDVNHVLSVEDMSALPA